MPDFSALKLSPEELRRRTLDLPAKFPNLPPDKTLVVDIESTTFDDKVDKVRQFNPFLGPRIAGVAIGVLGEPECWFLPMRYRGEDVQEGTASNCDIEAARRFLRDTLNSGRDVVNHNIKFDAWFWHHEGCWVEGKLVDTLTLARVVDNTRRSYSLGALTGVKDSAPKAYLKSIRSKDWGRLPIALVARYAMNDVFITGQLYEHELRKLKPEAASVWETEVALTKHLVRSEIRGIRVDVDRLRVTLRDIVKEIIELEERCHELAGEEFDPNSEKDLTRVLIGRLNIEPADYTPTGRPKWDNVTLMSCGHPIGPLIAKYSHLVHFSSTYCEGWRKRLDEDGRLHPKFNQGGTRTGRLSSSDPNFQNVPVEAEAFVLPDRDDDVIVGGDYSQIEYRLFGHYANDPLVLDQYLNNPKADFHQALADMLGVDRQFAKSCNFAFVYGMGKETLLRMIAGLCAVKSEDAEMQEKMRAFLTGAAKQSAQRAKALDTSHFTEIAKKVYEDYHRKFPSIRKLRRRVEDAIRARGWLRNYLGRVYRMDERSIHKGVNYLIQGSAADIFKQRLVALCDEVPEDCKLMTNVHDSIFFSVPREGVRDFLEAAERVLPAVVTPDFSKPLRVPLLVDFKVSASDWASVVKVKGLDELDSAIEQSREARGRAWGVTDDVERHTGHGTGPDWDKVRADTETADEDGYHG